MAGFAAAASATAGKAAAAKSAGVAAVAPAVNGLFGAITMRRQYKNQKKLMALQNQYDIEAFNRENERQNWLMLNEDSLKRQSLENAGYSTADPNGTGVTTPAVGNMDTPGTPTAPLLSGSPGTDFVNAFNAMRQSELIDSVKRKNEAEADKAEQEAEGQHLTNQYIMPRNEAELEKICAEIDKMEKDGNLSKVEAEVRKKLARSTCKLNAKQCEQIDQDIKNAQEEFKRIQEQINLLKAQEQTEKSVMSLNFANRDYVWENTRMTREQILGQKHFNLKAEHEASYQFLKNQELSIKNDLRRKLANSGVDLDATGISSIIGQKTVRAAQSFKEGVKRVFKKHLDYKLQPGM